MEFICFKRMRRQAPLLKAILTFGALLSVLPATAGTAAVANYPSHPIKMIVPFGAGGPTDTIARILADRMRVSLGQPVIIENVGGAAGSIGVGHAAHAAADGYTLSIGHWGTHAVNSLVFSLKYNVLQDLAPVSLVASNPYLILSKKTLPTTDLKALIAWLKANPNKATSSSNGIGSAGYLLGTKFQNATGTHFAFASYRGGTGGAMKDLVGGQLDLMFDQAVTAIPQVRGSTIKAYAVTANTRLAAAPNIPTVDEAGLPNFHMSAWHGLWVPKGTPKAIIAKLNAAVVDTLADPEVRKRLAQLGQEIPPRNQQTPQALAAKQKAEIAKWSPIIKTAHIKTH